MHQTQRNKSDTPNKRGSQKDTFSLIYREKFICHEGTKTQSQNKQQAIIILKINGQK